MQVTLTSPSVTSVCAATAAADPPIGLIEAAFKLWRTILASIPSPPKINPAANPAATCADLACISPYLAEMGSRLCRLAAMGDELMRPAMHVLDWLLLHERVIIAE